MLRPPGSEPKHFPLRASLTHCHIECLDRISSSSFSQRHFYNSVYALQQLANRGSLTKFTFPSRSPKITLPFIVITT